MGELSIVAIADALAAGIDVHDVTFIPGTVYRSKTLDHLIDPVVLPSFEEVRESKRTYAESFAIQYKIPMPSMRSRWQSRMRARATLYRIRLPSFDRARRWMMSMRFHTCAPITLSYEKDGGVPALGEINTV